MKATKILTERQVEILKDRCLDPKDFVFEKEKGDEIYFYDKVAKNTLVMKIDE